MALGSQAFLEVAGAGKRKLLNGSPELGAGHFLEGAGEQRGRISFSNTDPDNGQVKREALYKIGPCLDYVTSISFCIISKFKNTDYIIVGITCNMFLKIDFVKGKVFKGCPVQIRQFFDVKCFLLSCFLSSYYL